MHTLFVCIELHSYMCVRTYVSIMCTQMYSMYIRTYIAVICVYINIGILLHVFNSVFQQAFCSQVLLTVLPVSFTLHSEGHCLCNKTASVCFSM